MSSVLVPVLAGFAIGLVTNWLAIVMLFRPHRRRPWLVFWPQGLVPREREALAASVGAAVGGELLAPDHVARAFAGPEGRARTAELLERLVAATAGQLAEQPLSRLLGSVSWEAWAQSLGSWLQDPARRAELRARVVEALDERLRSLSRSTVLEALGPEVLLEAERFLAGRLRQSTFAGRTDEFVKKTKWFFTPSLVFEWLRGDAQRSAVARTLDDVAKVLMDALRSENVGHLLGVKDERAAHAAAELLADRFLAHLAEPANLRRVVELARERLAPLLEQTPAALTSALEPAVLAALRTALDGLVSEFLERHGAAMVAALDVGAVVKSRVDGYPVERLERMVLDVTGRHLTWITIWGGVLGALMGALQLLVP